MVRWRAPGAEGCWGPFFLSADAAWMVTRAMLSEVTPDAYIDTTVPTCPGSPKTGQNRPSAIKWS
jgi:hypothetical protein